MKINSARYRDTRLGTGYRENPILDLRLVEICYRLSWYPYLTYVLEPKIIPPYLVADLCLS